MKKVNIAAVRTLSSLGDAAALRLLLYVIYRVAI